MLVQLASPLSDVIYGPLASHLSDVMFCLHSGITNLSLYKHWVTICCAIKALKPYVFNKPAFGFHESSKKGKMFNPHWSQQHLSKLQKDVYIYDKENVRIYCHFHTFLELK